MVENKFSFDDGLDDLSSVLHNQSVSDLSWLAVDEKTYRALETLPKQNLDIIPELTRALTLDPADDVQKVVPLRPYNIVNENPASPKYDPVDQVNPIRNRVASYIISGLDQNTIKDKLNLEFSPESIKLASKHIKSLEGERGLLGNVYIDSQYIIKCDQEQSKARKTILACSKKALYVIGKSQCNNCVKNVNGRCASLQKTIVDSVPYGPKLASHYAPYLQSTRKASSLNNENLSWKERIRLSFLDQTALNPEGVQTIQTLRRPVETKVTPEDIAGVLTRKPENRISLSSSYVKYAKRMMEGKNDVEFMEASGDEDLIRLSSEYGLLGHYYLDMDALGGCKNTLRHVQEKGCDPKYIVRRNAKCSICHDLADGACARLCKTSKISSSGPIYNRKNFERLLSSRLESGHINDSMYSIAKSRLASDLDYKSLTAQLYLYEPKESAQVYREASIKGHYISTPSSQRQPIDSEEVRMFISHLMNTGLSGTRLTDAVLNRYTTEDLKDHGQIGRRLASEEGLQGSYYLDPTAYRDYGHGCSEGASLFKNRGPRNIMASSQCTGCMMQTAPGWCSRYCKNLIRTVPKSIRKASKVHLPIISTASVINPIEKYELSHEMDVSPENLKQSLLDMSIPSASID